MLIYYYIFMRLVTLIGFALLQVLALELYKSAVD